MNVSASISVPVRYPQSSAAVGDEAAPQAAEPEETTATGDVKKTAEVEAEKAQKVQDDSVLRQLRARDREVRSHEAAHSAAGGSLVSGGPSFTFQSGPDGRSYAIGGEVQIDTSPVKGDPQATIAKANQVRAAALAPAEPSGQDVKVASNASQLAAQARVELAAQRREEVQAEKTESESEDDGDVESTESDTQPIEGVASNAPAGSAVDATDSAISGNRPTSEAKPSASRSNSSVSQVNDRANTQAIEAISAFLANSQPQPATQGFSQYV